jgi:tetratricopeptide (TPR) repeat protein
MRATFIFILALAASTAHADSSPAAAFNAGLVAYNAGDYTTAIAAFESAFRLDPKPEVAFTLAQAHRNQYFVDRDVTHLQRALGLYRHYLTESPVGRRAAHARMHLETIEQILATLPAQAPVPPDIAAPPTQLLITANVPGARASIDDGPLSNAPHVVEVKAGSHHVRVEADGHAPMEIEALAVEERLVVVPVTLRASPAHLVVRTRDDAEIHVDDHPSSARSELPAGTHTITIRARGHEPVVRTVELLPGKDLCVDVELARTPRRRAALVTLYGSAGLAGVAGVAAGVAYLAQRDAIAISESLDESADIDAHNAALDRRDTWRGVALGFALAEGAAAVTGGALYWFDMRSPGEPTRQLTPIIGPETVGAAVVGSF